TYRERKSRLRDDSVSPDVIRRLSWPTWTVSLARRLQKQRVEGTMETPEQSRSRKIKLVRELVEQGMDHLMAQLIRGEEPSPMPPFLSPGTLKQLRESVNLSNPPTISPKS